MLVRYEYMLNFLNVDVTSLRPILQFAKTDADIDDESLAIVLYIVNVSVAARS